MLRFYKDSISMLKIYAARVNKDLQKQKFEVLVTYIIYL